MKVLQKFSASALVLGLALSSTACVANKLEPASADQKVANKPNAAATDLKGGVRFQVEANAWMADERVKNEVTAMKVTIINRGEGAVSIDYNAFVLTTESGKSFKPVPPKDIAIRGKARSIGLPADTIITRSSDSAVNRPDRETSEKDEIRERLENQALKTGELPAGERTVGYVYFERIPATAKQITFKGGVQDPKTGEPGDAAELEFRPRQYQ